MTRDIIFQASVLGGALVAGMLVQAVAFGIWRAIERRKAHAEDFRYRSRFLQSPVRVLLPGLCVLLVIPFTGLPADTEQVVRHVLSIVLILTVAWLLIRIIHTVRSVLMLRYRLDVEDNLAARKVHTQWRLIERILDILIGLVAVACVLTTFDVVRNVGMSILASAGILGIILGFASQKTLGTLISGLQIAITQPIRLDDVVIVEGEWGRIEEITLTYVVVRIWDERRLVVPVTYFQEKVFQNWTRSTAQLLGTVTLHTDYTVSVDAVREELKRIVEKNELWDRRVCVLQVTEAGEQSMQLRALVSARDASEAWTLRCQVREQLIDYLQREAPGALPRLRLVGSASQDQSDD